MFCCRQKNKKDVAEIEPQVIDGIMVTYLERMDQVFGHMLEKEQLENPTTKFKSRKSDKEHAENEVITVN
jgi:hypothetical protein